MKIASAMISICCFVAASIIMILLVVSPTSAVDVGNDAIRAAVMNLTALQCAAVLAACGFALWRTAISFE